MTDQNTPDTGTGGKRKGGSLQTKALAGLVAVMLAAAIVALVFVTSGSDKSNQQAGATQPTSSDVGRASTPTAEPSVSTSADPASTAASSTTAPSTPAASSSAASSTTAAAPATTKAPPSRTSHSSNAKKVVYTVKKGDTLTDIGAWYKLHGYLKLYDWNKSVIGKNPDLIFPGQQIIVSDGKVGVSQK